MMMKPITKRVNSLKKNAKSSAFADALTGLSHMLRALRTQLMSEMRQLSHMKKSFQKQSVRSDDKLESAVRSSDLSVRIIVSNAVLKQ